MPSDSVKRETGEYDLDSGYRIPEQSLVRPDISVLCDSFKNSRYLQILTILTIAGAFLRLYGLAFEPLWLDEALTYQFSLNPFAEYWSLISAGGEVHPPLFYWMEHGMLAFGSSETVLRLLPALFGILAIPAVYLLGREAVDRNVGLLAAALIAFSPFHLFYSQEARMYAILSLFLVLALFFFIRAYRKDNTLDWVLFAIFSALAFWTHFYSAILIAGAFLWGGIQVFSGDANRFNRAKQLFISLCIFILLALPLILISWTILLGRTASSPAWGNQGMEAISTAIRQFSGYSELLGVLYAILFILGLYVLFREKRQTFSLFLWLFVLVLAASSVLSYIMPMSPRYMIGILPVFFIGIASSYRLIDRIRPDRRVIYLLLIAIVLVNAPALADHYSEMQKENWRDLAVLLGKNTAPGDIVVVMPGYMAAPFDFYYDNVTDGTIEMGLSSAGELGLLLDEKGDRKIFVAFTDDLNAADTTGRAVQWLKDNAQYAGDHGRIHVFVIT